MTQFSPNEIAGIIYWVGGWGPNKLKPIDDAGKNRVIKWLDTAIAICLAESSGVVEATNGSGESLVVGLWQIKKSAHSTIVAVNALRYGGQPLSNPLVNTACARDVYKEAGGWGPWTKNYASHKGHGAAAYDYIHNPANLTALKTKLATLGYPVVSISADEMTGNSSIIGGNLVKSNLGEQADKVKDSISSQVDKIIGVLKNAGVASGVFLLGAILLILGVVFMLQRAGVAKKVPGPIGVVSGAVSAVKK